MAGALNSGRSLIIEFSEQTFADVIVSGLWRDETRACSNGYSVWVQRVNLADIGFSWIELRSNSEIPQRFPSALIIPYGMQEVRDRFPSDFTFLQTLPGSVAAVISVNARAASQSAGLPAARTVAAVFELTAGSPNLSS